MKVTRELLEESSAATMPLRVAEGDGCAVIIWMPGDGTRYRVLITEMPDDVCAAMDCTPGSVLVTTNGRSATCRAGEGRRRHGPHVWHYTYVLEKLGQSEQTTYAVAGIVNAALGIDAAYAVECMRSEWTDFAGYR